MGETKFQKKQPELSDLELPSPPQALAAIVQAASDPDTPAAKLSQLVSSDPAFSARILAMVNSSLYSRGTTVTAIGHAVGVLGARQLRNIALCAAAQACVSKREVGEFHLGRFWENSLRRAVAFQVLAERTQSIDPMSAFTIGLLQDLGVLALVKNFPDVAKDWMAIEKQSPQHRRERERELFGMTHDEVASDLARRWGLPDELSVPMRFHHESDDAPEGDRQICELAEHAECLGAVLVSTDARQELERLRLRLSEFLGLTRFETDRLVMLVANRVTETATALGIKVKRQPKLDDIRQEAFEGIVQLNMSYDDVIKHLEVALDAQDKLTRELEVRNRELECMALTDALTELPNRRAFWDVLVRSVEDTDRGSSTTLVLIDADHFKRVNDEYGHDAGDVVLVHLAQVMKSCVGDDAMLARIGGEEFAVVLEAAKQPLGEKVAERLVTKLRECPCEVVDGKQLKLTISVGIASLKGPRVAGVDLVAVTRSLYRCADEALYAAKESGRDRYVAAMGPVTWSSAPPPPEVQKKRRWGLF